MLQCRWYSRCVVARWQAQTIGKWQRTFNAKHCCAIQVEKMKNEKGIERYTVCHNWSCACERVARAENFCCYCFCQCEGSVVWTVPASAVARAEKIGAVTARARRERKVSSFRFLWMRARSASQNLCCCSWRECGRVARAESLCLQRRRRTEGP